MASNLALKFIIILSYVWKSEQTIDDVQVEELHSWKYPVFEFLNLETETAAIVNKQLIPGTGIIIDSDLFVDPNTGERTFYITTPSLMPGAPVTLSKIIQADSGDVLLQPFPSWEANNKKFCDNLISTYRIQIDRCGYLWAIDNGVLNFITDNIQLCPPKILTYDLNNNGEEINRYEVPEEYIKQDGLYFNLVIESSAEDCSDSIVYIADGLRDGLLVYDWQKNASWRVQNKYFLPYPDYVVTTINGVSFELADGIFGLALSPPSQEGVSTLFWHCYASITEAWVATDFLKDPEVVNDGKTLNAEIKLSEGSRRGQSTVEVITENNIMIFASVTENALVCWNIATPYVTENQHIVFQDTELLQFVTGMKIRGKELFVNSSSLQNNMAGTPLATDAIKYRMFRIDNVDELLKGTPCVV